MKKLEWDNSFSVSVAELDEQHQKLIDLINQLYETWEKSKNADTKPSLMDEMSIQCSIIQNLLEYTEYHFVTEEQYMKKYQYPGYDLQRKEHEDFIRKIRATEEKFRAGREVRTTDIIRFLAEWIKEHIMGMDKLYGPHFNKNGLY